MGGGKLNGWLVVLIVFNNITTYLLMTTDSLFTVCGHHLRVWWGVGERRATPNVYIFNWSRDVPSHLTKMQNSLSGVISCLLIIIYSTIISSCPFHAYVWCLFTGQSIGKSIGLIVITLWGLLSINIFAAKYFMWLGMLNAHLIYDLS